MKRGKTPNICVEQSFISASIYLSIYHLCLGLWGVRLYKKNKKKSSYTRRDQIRLQNPKVIIRINNKNVEKGSRRRRRSWCFVSKGRAMESFTFFLCEASSQNSPLSNSPRFPDTLFRLCPLRHEGEVLPSFPPFSSMLLLLPLSTTSLAKLLLFFLGGDWDWDCAATRPDWKWVG